MSSTSLSLPENLKAMILLNALPHSYKPVTSTIVQTTTAIDFTLDNVIPNIMSKSQLQSSTNMQSLIHCITQEPAEANQTSVIQHAPRSTETCSHCGKSHPSNRCWAKFGHPSQTSYNRGSNASNRRKKPYNPNRSGSNQKGKGRGAPNQKGKGKVTIVDGIANIVEMDIDEHIAHITNMEVDEYKMQEHVDFDSTPLHAVWADDDLDERPIAGPSMLWSLSSV